MRFYLGTHEPSWVARAGVPLFLSHRRLKRQRSFHKAIAPWALDSGGFSELSTRGSWATSMWDYLRAVYRYSEAIGPPDWIAPQDWMCEPPILALTGLSIREHQDRTIASVIALREMTSIAVIPVLQGWDIKDYLECWALYEDAGLLLLDEPLVGVGSVCRRQHTTQIQEIFTALQPLRLHGFGVKTGGLALYGNLLTSADSMAWSFNARRNPPLPECAHAHCSNCLRFALRWRERLLHINPTQEATH